LHVLHHAWKDDGKILIISTEMSKINLAMRFFSINLHMPYQEIRRGRLGEFAEKEFYKGVEDLLNDKGLNIVSGDFDYTMDNIEAAIDVNRPDILGVDGPYLIKNSGKDRHEKVSNNFDDFKRLGRKYKHATITNLQFNRAAKTGQKDTISADNIGITDVAGWNADIIYGLMRSEEQRQAGIMGVKALKIREGQVGDFEVNWNFESMDFSEVASGAGPADGAPKSRPKSVETVAAPDPVADNFDDVPF